jgi:hypothetical protein
MAHMPPCPVPKHVLEAMRRIPAGTVLPVNWTIDFETLERFTGRARGGRNAVEAIGRVYCQIAWLSPGHDPGASGGVATTARQRAFLALGYFGSKTRPQRRCEVTWAATRPRAGQRRAAQVDVATRAAQSDSTSVAQASVS